MGGHGHGIPQRGRIVGHRGNNSNNNKPDHQRQRGAAQTTIGQVVAPHGIHHNVQRGIRAKAQNTITAGERYKNQAQK